MVFVPLAQAPPKLTQSNCCTVYSLNLILSLHLHTFTSVFSTNNLLYVGLPRKAFPGKQAKVDTGHQCFSVVAQAGAKIRPRPAQWLFSNERTWRDNWTHCSNECWMKVGEGWVCWVQLANMWQNCSLSAVQMWKSHDGLNWTCLDQCHCVRSLRTSSSQGWHKRNVIWHSTVMGDPWVYIRVFNQPASCRFAETGLCQPQASAKIRPRPAWIWHVWINAMAFVPLAQAPPQAGATEMLYDTANNDPWVYICVFNQPALCRFA